MFSPGSHLRKRSGKGQGLCDVEGTELGKDSCGVEPQPGTEPGADSAVRKEEEKAPSR